MQFLKKYNYSTYPNFLSYKSENLLKNIFIIISINNKMKPQNKVHGQSFLAKQNSQSTQSEPQSVIQKANELVDSVTNLLCKEIATGFTLVPEQEKPLIVYLRSEQKSLMKIQSQTLAIDEHKRMVRKLMRENKSLRKKRQMRSFEQSQKSLRIQKQIMDSKLQQRNSTIQQRRKDIEKRMEQKKAIIKEIKKEVMISSEKFKNIRKKKFLYQEKEEEFVKKFLLPKIQQEKRMIEKKKEVFRTPMDHTEINFHEKKYEEMRITEEANRQLNFSRMITEQLKSYSPPQYVPNSFRLVEKEQKLKKEEEQIKKKQVEINDLRKKQYARQIQELREREKQLSRSKTPPERPKKQKVKQKLTRQETKKKGDDYLKQIIISNRKLGSRERVNQTALFEIQQPKRKLKSEYEIEIIREERIQKIHKIKAKKIEGIVRDKKLDDISKYQRLRHESQLLDEAAIQKLGEGEDVETMNESASIMMNSINAKLAMLAFNSAKKI